MKCKKCKKTIETKQYGLKGFCSMECKEEYKASYNRLNAKKQRKKKKTIHSINTPKVRCEEPTVSTILESNLDPLETLYNSFGGKKWYDISKKYCCNFDVKEKEDYCITLAEPYEIFECFCSNCILGIALMTKQEQEKKKKEEECQLKP